MDKEQMARDLEAAREAMMTPRQRRNFKIGLVLLLTGIPLGIVCLGIMTEPVVAVAVLAGIMIFAGYTFIVDND